jgi:hypothetical protein
MLTVFFFILQIRDAAVTNSGDRCSLLRSEALSCQTAPLDRESGEDPRTPNAAANWECSGLRHEH